MLSIYPSILHSSAQKCFVSTSTFELWAAVPAAYKFFRTKLCVLDVFWGSDCPVYQEVRLDPGFIFGLGWNQ